jgi:hypothetical protein
MASVFIFIECRQSREGLATTLQGYIFFFLFFFLFPKAFSFFFAKRKKKACVHRDSNPSHQLSLNFSLFESAPTGAHPRAAGDFFLLG